MFHCDTAMLCYGTSGFFAKTYSFVIQKNNNYDFLSPAASSSKIGRLAAFLVVKGYEGGRLSAKYF